jgi:hypothetical protein
VAAAVSAVLRTVSVERALAIRDRILGHNHPDTVATRRALAELAAGARGQADE